MKKEVGQKYRILNDSDNVFKRGEIVTLVEIECDKISYYINEEGTEDLLYDIDHEDCEVELIDKNDDKVNSPNHYIGDNGIEVEDVLIGFINRYENGYVAHRVSSAIEYLLRSPLKNGKEDIEKAKKNLEQALNYLNSIDNKN